VEAGPFRTHDARLQAEKGKAFSLEGQGYYPYKQLKKVGTGEENKVETFPNSFHRE